MNAFGPGSFENDVALELVSHLMDSADASARVLEILHSATNGAATVEACAEAVAAAEIVAAGRSKPALDLPDEVREMVALYLVYVDDDGVRLAARAVSGVMAEGSALRAFWRDDPQWLEIAGSLQARLATIVVQ